jgi:TolB protein
MRVLLGILLAAAQVFAQGNADIFATIRGGQKRPSIALPDFRGAGESAGLAKTFNDTLWEEISDSGGLDIVAKSFYPTTVPQQPADFHPGGATLSEWSNPPVKANYLAFGYLSVQDSKTLVLFGWLDNVMQPDPATAQLFGRRYYGPLDAEGAKKVAREFAADILRQFNLKSLAGTSIYFVSDRTGQREIWSMDYDGGNAKQLTHNRGNSKEPTVSPDAKLFAYTMLTTRPGETAPSWNITVQSVDAGKRLKFTNPPAPTNTTPDFAPDGRHVLFASTLSGWANIYIANLDGTDRRRLTNFDSIDVSPRVNPKTGRDVLFISGRSGKQQLWRMNIDGGDLEMLTNGEGEVANPCWSPDGRFVAFAWTRGYEIGGFNIFVMDIADRKPIQLTKDSGVNENPWWAPDGLHIVYTSRRGRSTQVFSMLADGTRVRQLTHEGNNVQPVWAPPLQ